MFENVSWTFSAAAQSLAAVVAFLLAGYALIHSMMESRAAADDSLIEINDKLSKDYHRQLSILMSTTVAAIVADLLVVYVNSDDGAPYWLQFVGAALAVFSFVAAVRFVVRIIDPDRYQRAARQLARPSDKPGSERADAAGFFEVFVQVERLLRELWESQGESERLSGRAGPPTMREMIEVLHLNRVLPLDLVKTLRAVVQTRNVVFHGRLESVSEDQLKDARRVKQELERAARSE